MPEVVSLAIARPHGFQNLGQNEWASLVTSAFAPRKQTTASDEPPKASRCSDEPKSLGRIHSTVPKATPHDSR